MCFTVSGNPYKSTNLTLLYEYSLFAVMIEKLFVKYAYFCKIYHHAYYGG